MIQPLKPSKVSWILRWIDLDQPVPGAHGHFLPTVVFVTDAEGRPVGPPAAIEELDQARVEGMLLRMFDMAGVPDRLVVTASDDWDDRDWEDFGREQRLEIRIQRIGNEPASGTDPLVAAGVIEGPSPVPPSEIAGGLVRSAARLRSETKREKQLRKALALDPDCSAARVELADIEFHRGNWKACMAGYDETIARESKRWKGRSPDWWEDRATRPYLRALYGRAMTLWHRGRYAEAAAQLEALVALNPRDNQGARLFIPLLHLLAEDPSEAAASFARYAARYPDDLSEPSLLFGWGLSLSLEGDEAGARAKYREAMLRNIYIAPLLLEEPLPPRNIWLPSDRAEYPYASDFLDSYAVLWDRESGAMRLLRETWEEMRPRIEQLVAHREQMADLQDQRYDPDYKNRWQEMLDLDDRLSDPNVTNS